MFWRLKDIFKGSISAIDERCSVMDLIRSKPPGCANFDEVDPKNRNKHPEDQIERLKQIIQYQGLRKLIVIVNPALDSVRQAKRRNSSTSIRLKAYLRSIKTLNWEEQENSIRNFGQCYCAMQQN